MRRRGARALGRWAILAGLGCLATLGELRAQSPTDSAAAPRRPSVAAPRRPGVPALVRYGKWVALGSAIALGYKANALHHDANDSYDALQSRCFDVPGSCTLDPDGHYTDPVAERLYTDTHDHDRAAARYLIGAEVSFALAATGFIWELVVREDHTPNIPFEPRVEAGATSTRVGLTLRF